ncbi:MAG: hypothetical protein OEZ68_16335 [Gammaproteobacteria bacterium]|nr:hypothetical protein [Gammaproteobacteria bacterium]MDH5802370.1 hypothetical protein [Gammaproteobacteria bacterium]
MKKTVFVVLATVLGIGLTVYITPVKLPTQLLNTSGFQEINETNPAPTSSNAVLQNAALYSNHPISANVNVGHDMLDIEHSMDLLERDMNYIKSYSHSQVVP